MAAGQTVNNLQVVEHLPSNIYFLGNVTGGTLATPVAPGIYSAQDLVINLGNVVGAAGVDRVVTFDYYVPYANTSGTPIIGRTDGSGNDDRPVVNDAEVTGTWVPLDPDDAAVTISMDAEVFANGAISTTPDNDEQFDAKAIAIQKGVTIVASSPGGAAGYNPGDIVRYTLNFQISDYFNFGNIVVTDVLPDGLDFLNAADGYAPAYTISDGFGSYSGSWTPGAT